MIAAKEPVSISPKDYNSWLECFKNLENRELDSSSYSLLVKGTCYGYSSVNGYFNQQLVKAVNSLIKKSVSVFSKNLSRYSEENHLDDLYLPFARLAKKLELCMFFTELDFLDKEFKDELTESAVHEITTFWQGMLNSLKKQIASDSSRKIEEEYFRIKRIQVLKNYIQ